ncbi:MAG: hypothetical protein Fur0043_26720 [Anaerolineales bacterium]
MTMPTLPIDWRRVAMLAGMAFLVILILDFNARLEMLDRLNKQATLVRAEATQAALTQVALKTQVAYAISNQAVEEVARSEGHMIQDGDHPVVILGQVGAPPLQTPTPTPSPMPQPNWQLWWELFFSE